MTKISRKKFLMVIRSLKFWSWTENACVRLWEQLIEQWYDVSYFSFYKDDCIYKHKWQEYCLLRKSKFLFMKVWYSIIWAIKLLKFCKCHNVDFVIAYMWSGILTSLLSKIFWNKSKVCIYLHRCMGDFPKWITRLLIYFSKRYSKKIIVLTEYEKNYLLKKFNLDKDFVSVIPNFIDLEHISTLCLEPIYGNNNYFFDNKFIFITIGRLEKIKNQELMINAFKKLNEKYPNISLIILWDWKDKQNLKNIANENVYFLWNQENVFQFLSQSDCFLLTSESESFSIAILEAMACNLPIISTKTQWPCEILENGKYWILVCHDEKSLYDAMEKILTNKKLREYYKHQSKERVKRYQKNEIIKQWEKIFNE